MVTSLLAAFALNRYRTAQSAESQLLQATISDRQRVEEREINRAGTLVVEAKASPISAVRYASVVGIPGIFGSGVRHCVAMIGWWSARRVVGNGCVLSVVGYAATTSWN